MKVVTLLALSFLIATAPVLIADEKPPEFVKVQTVDGKTVWITKDVLKEAYQEAFGKPKPKLSDVERAKFGLKVRQEAYAWAYAPTGMNLRTDDANAFAEDMASRPHPLNAFAGYKAAYAYAEMASGLNMRAADARVLADKFSRLDEPLEMLEVFKTAYKFAYSPEGMNKRADEALAYALKAVGLK